MTLGNHEYDWGEDYILENYELAEFPFLAINIYDNDTNKLVEYCQPSVMVEKSGVQIGIIGAIGDCYSSISADKVEVCPNSIDPQDMRLNADERTEMRQKYSIPVDKKVFVYGGNLGKPQGIPFLIDCLKSQHQNEDAFFLIVGSGTEYDLLERYVTESAQANVKLMRQLPKEDYDRMIAACDVGMIFLDHRFTIPNFPSRLLSYLQAKLPVLACTDPNTDVGEVITQAGFGWWCESSDEAAFSKQVHEAMQADLPKMGEIGYEYLCEYYTAEKAYEVIRHGICSG
jgi:glycosyltransferase involved in cell wall biosynthesis